MEKIFRLKFLVFLSSAIILSLLSCDKEKPLAPHKNVLSAMVNGVPFIPSEMLVEKEDYGGGPTLYISATDARNRTIYLLIKNYHSVITSEKIDTVAHKTIASYSDGLGPLALSRALSGTVTISSLDKTLYSDGEVVKGTFEFVTEKGIVNPIPYAIIDGSFSVFIKK